MDDVELVECDHCGTEYPYADRVAIDMGDVVKEFCSERCYINHDSDCHARAVDHARDIARGV